MSDEDALKRIEARLTRLEATLSQQPAAAAGHFGPVVDPVPWGGGGWGGGWGGWGGGWGGGRPHPIVDPAVYAPQYRYNPQYIVDPVPFPYGQGADPYTAGAAQQASATAAFRRFGPVMDPPPIDVSRFNIEQLEATLHSINAEKARLTSMETMVKQQLEKKQKEG